jgi:subtilisin family serine protease
MIDVVCPNCNSVTPPFQYCLVCNSFLADQLRHALENRHDKATEPANRRWANYWGFLSYLLALLRSLRKRLMFSSKSGTELNIQMDAHLRRDCRRVQKHGICKLATSSTKEDEVAVIAKVNDLDGFKNLEQVRIVTIIEGTNEDQTTLVTARIKGDEQEIELVRNHSFVLSLKAARRMRPFLEQAKRETLMPANLLATDLQANGGEGVIIGIVDFGLDFRHRNFCNSDGNTRILALWDQKAPFDKHYSPEPFRYGRLIKEDQINEALKKADPYQALAYEASRNSLFDTGSHGTYIADIAAGNGLGSNCPGIAPKANIVFVDVSTAGTRMQGGQAVGSTFGDSVQLLEAIKFIFDYAKDQPCVINISLGSNGGPHDGTTPVEDAIDRLVKQKPNRAVVIAAGNSFGKSLHAAGCVPNGGYVDLKWQIPRFDPTGNELELWYAGEDRFSVEILNPDGKCVARVRPCQIWETTESSKGRMSVVNRLGHPHYRDNTITVFFERGVSAGVWTLRLLGDAVRDGNFHVWIDRDDQGQSRFVKPKDKSYVISNDCTLNSIACGYKAIVVGSYNAYETNQPLSDTSSSGPTRDKRQQPTISAPGEKVMAAQSGTLVLRHRQSGTSIAAAVVTGTVALMLSEALAAGITLATEQIRDILIRTARKSPTGGNQWDSGYGHGRVCIKTAIEDVTSGTESNHQQASAAGLRRQ